MKAFTTVLEAEIELQLDRSKIGGRLEEEGE